MLELDDDNEDDDNKEELKERINEEDLFLLSKELRNEYEINNVQINTEINHAKIGGGILMSGKASSLIGQVTITDKEFYKAM